MREIKTIAVLPFEDLSAEQREKYLGISLADALANKFSGMRQITVRPMRTVLKYADSRDDITKIGRELQVDAVLDGRIQHVGERIRVSVQLIRTSENFPIALHYKARVLFRMGRQDEAFEIYRKVIAATGSAYFKADIGCLYGRAGRDTEARKILAELYNTAKEKYVSPYYFALVHIGLNERDKAFEYLRKAVAEHDNNVIVLKTSAQFDKVRDDPQLIEILRSANF